MPMTPVFIDTDAGTDVDDALALAFAAKSRQIRLVGVGTVSGNAPLRARIAANVLGAAGCLTAKVAAGVSSEDGMVGHEGKGFLEWQGEKASILEQNASDFLAETVNHATEALSIVGIGPLTNIAKSFREHPEILKKINRLYLMGGSIYPEKLLQLNHATLPELYVRRFETNFNSNIEAAKLVLESGVPITIVPIEITAQTFLTAEDLLALQASGTPLSQMLVGGVNIWIPIFTEILGRIGMPQAFAKPYLHDPLTVAAVTHPELFDCTPMHIYPTVQNGVFCTMTDGGKAPNMDVVTGVDVPAFRKILLERLTA